MTMNGSPKELAQIEPGTYDRYEWVPVSSKRTDQPSIHAVVIE